MSPRDRRRQYLVDDITTAFFLLTVLAMAAGWFD